MHVIGLDIGTTGCKAALFDEGGSLLRYAMREYPIQFPAPGWAEQDAELVWQRACECLAEIAFLVSGKSAIGLSVQGEAVIPVDRNGNPLRAAILGMDTRTNSENAWLREQFGGRALFERTGMPIHTINTLPKLLWLERHESRLWKQAHQFLLYEDFIARKLTGHAVISECLASRTQLFDTRTGQWAADLCTGIHLDVERLANIQPSGIVIGEMGLDLARSLGFPVPPLIVSGGHDQACAALGVGLTMPGLAMVSTGTAEVVEIGLASHNADERLYEGNISIYHHVVPKMFLAMTLNHSGGLLLRWFRDTLSPLEAAAADDPYDALLRGMSSEPSALLVLPHFEGSGTPKMDTKSKGAILGLTFQTSKTDIAQAVLEGLTFELRQNLDLLRASGVKIDELRAVGGGARSDYWLQLKADICGIPILRPSITNASCWGAALLAGIGAGCFGDLREVASQSVHIDQVFQPDADRAARYEQRYALYQELYPAVVDLNHRLS